MKGEVRPDHQQELGESRWEKTPDTLDQVIHVLITPLQTKEPLSSFLF